MPRFRFGPDGRMRLHELDRLLHQAYGAPEILLGNKTDPLEEAVYIILSFQSDLTRFKKTWQRLRSTFPHWSNGEQATLGELSASLQSGGLHRQKAAAIKRLLRVVRQQFGVSLDALRQMPEAEAERTLTRLPGMSWKGARCVLLYSLDRKVFPIDGNSFRILQRAGVIPLSAVYRRLSLHDGIQKAVDPGLRIRFHVNLVVHGQEVCLPQRPRCKTCPAASICPRRGQPLRSHGPAPSRLEVVELQMPNPRKRPPRSNNSKPRTSRSSPGPVAVAG